MDILNEDSECASRKKHDEMLNDPVFAGAEFFFPPCDDPEDEGCGEEFTEEGFKDVAKEILGGKFVLGSRNIGRIGIESDGGNMIKSVRLWYNSELKHEVGKRGIQNEREVDRVWCLVFK